MRKSGKGRVLDDLDEWFNGNRKTTSKSAGSGGGITIPTNRKPAPKAQAAKNIINGVNSAKGSKSASSNSPKKKLPQVVVKISGSSKGADKAAAHLAYTGRKGQVELEDEKGNKYLGDEQKGLIKSWQAAGFHDKEETGTKREAFHFVFSMPAGTDPKGLKDAVRNLVQEEFAGHKYFMAQHLDTDKPHCHVLVCATDDRGARLNPRKQDLHNYRVAFVNKLAEQDIEATASRNVSRFKSKSNKKQWKIHKDSRDGKPYKPKPPTPKSKAQLENMNKETMKAYEQYAKKLPAGTVKNAVKELVNHSQGRGR